MSQVNHLSGSLVMKTALSDLKPLVIPLTLNAINKPILFCNAT